MNVFDISANLMSLGAIDFGIIIDGAVIINIITLSLRPILDYTALSFGLTGLAMGWSLFRYRLLDLMPVARDQVFESMLDAVFVLDPAGQIVDLNPAAEQIFGVTSDRAIGKLMVEAFPSYKTAILPFARVQDVRTEIEVGEQIFDLQISPLSARTRQNAGRLIVLRDITPRKKVEAEREALISELDAYAHTVAHDLKNPLGNVLGYAEDLLELYEELPQAERTADLQAIIRSAKSMNSIINNLLLLASVRNQDTIETTPLDMHQIVENVLARLERTLSEAGAQITLTEGWPPVQGYAPWVEEIWANYLSNAVKYGGKPPHLTLGAAASPDGQICFYVQDNGPGLTPPEQQALFIQFSRLDQHRHLDGHGLGLSIVQRIAHKLHGRVGLESTPGAGTTFYFTLPVALIHEEKFR
jgi:PAS domain S-box-containing protein